jgi:PAS domain S-box-containing protein
MPGFELIAGGFAEADDALAVLERMEEGFYALSRDWRIVAVNRSAEGFWKRGRDELVGRTMFELFPEFEGSPAWEAHRDGMAAAAPTTAEVVSTATGRPVQLRFFPSPDGLSVYFLDVTHSRQMQEELRTRNELLTLAEESAGIGVWVADLEAGTMVGTPQFYHLLGIEPVAGPVPRDLPRGFRHADDRDRISAAFRDAVAAGASTFDSEYRIIRPDGEVRWIFGRGRVLRDAAGRPVRYSGIDIDVTERKQQEEHLRVVMRELLHRSNNLLTVVQGMLRQTARSSRSLPDFVPAFSDRLKALSETGSLLTRQDWHGADAGDLVRAQAAPFADLSRFDLAGPPVTLSPRAVQNLGLALHELCTNAIKYGALSVPEGRVAVDWQVEGSGAAALLRLVWRERLGPPVRAPRREGFGRVVTEKMIASALGAEVRTDFDRGGLVWTLALPAAEFTVPVPRDLTG